MAAVGRVGMDRFHRERPFTFALAFVLASAACSDGPTGTPGSIQVTVNPTTLSVPQGGSGSVTAALTRNGGFTGSVTLAIGGLPAGITTNVVPAQLTGTTPSATVNVSVAGTVAPGSYSATVTASGQGIGQATTTFPVSVTAAADYTLTAPATLTISAGSSGNTTVNIARANFTGAVALTLVNPPTGIAGVFNPASSTTNTSALAVSVAANVVPGNYPLTIQGTAAGLPNRSASVQLTVTPPPAGGTAVEYQYCDPFDVPVFFAYQDGTAAWQVVTGSTTGVTTTFNFNLTQARAGVLMVFRTTTSENVLAAARRVYVRPRSQLGRRLSARAPSGASGLARADIYQTSVLYGSAAELAQDGSDNCAASQPTKTVTGTVAGIPAGALGIVSFGYTTHIFIGGVSTNPLTFEVPPGLTDLVGSRLVTPGTPPDKLVIFRGLNIPNGGALPSAIDFNGPASSVPATANVTISGAAGDNVETFVDLVSANGQLSLWFELAPSPATTRTWAGLNATVMQSTDYHGLVVFASPPNNESNFRLSLKYVGPVANQNIALGPQVNVPVTSPVAAGAYPRLRFQGTLPADYNKGATIDVVSPQPAGNAFSIVATNTYLAAAGNPLAYDFTMPDIAGLAGFPAAARLTSGTNDLTVSGVGFNGPGVFELRPTLGTELKAALRFANIIVP